MNILRELFFGNIGEGVRKPKYYNKKKNEKEEDLYNQIKNLLGENEKIFEEFLELYDERFGEYQIESYSNGFRTGLLMGIDCIDIDL